MTALNKVPIFPFRDIQRKRSSRFLLISWSLLLLTVLVACDLSGTHTQSSKPTPTQLASRTVSIPCSSHSSDPVTLNMLYVSEKQAWIEDVVKDFNSRNVTACDGPITVKAIPIGSGQSMQDILSGADQPDGWSPA